MQARYEVTQKIQRQHIGQRQLPETLQIAPDSDVLARVILSLRSLPKDRNRSGNYVTCSRAMGGFGRPVTKGLAQVAQYSHLLHGSGLVSVMFHWVNQMEQHLKRSLVPHPGCACLPPAGPFGSQMPTAGPGLREASESRAVSSWGVRQRVAGQLMAEVSRSQLSSRSLAAWSSGKIMHRSASRNITETTVIILDNCFKCFAALSLVRVGL